MTGYKLGFYVDAIYQIEKGHVVILRNPDKFDRNIEELHGVPRLIQPKK